MVSDSVNIVVEGNSLVYQKIEQGTEKGKQMLKDNLGFTYNRQQPKGFNGVYWQCTHRPKENPCKVRVKEKGGQFSTSNKCKHNHAVPKKSKTRKKSAVAAKVDEVHFNIHVVL